MKVSKKKQALQRQVIQRKIARVGRLLEAPPASGWIRAIRGSLGMTVKQLADRLGVAPSSVTQMEEREPELKVTLETLSRAANAMDCALVYAIVPRSVKLSLEEIIDRKAYEAAARIVTEVEHTMRLEDQGSSSADSKRQIERIAAELKLRGDSRIWDSVSPKKKTSRSV